MNLSDQQREELFHALSKRFDENMSRHAGLAWEAVQARLTANPQKLWSLNEMERTEGEPDVIGYDEETGEFIFCDCSAETPQGRRSICYDHQALKKRKQHPPADSAVNMAEAMGIALLTEEQTIALYQLGDFDRKTSSWIATPSDVREKGGALFSDHRYGRTFIYHNGADSYYASRGFRGILKV